MIDENRLLEEQRRGANSRALGSDELDNPWLKQENTPKQTGMALEDYSKLHDAWATGWKMENAMRGN